MSKNFDNYLTKLRESINKENKEVIHMADYLIKNDHKQLNEIFTINGFKQKYLMQPKQQKHDLH